MLIEYAVVVGIRWTEDEVKKLIAMYPNNNTFDIAKVLGRSLESVQVKAERLRLKKSKEYIISKGRETGKRSALLRGHKVWSEEDLKKFKKLYPITPIRELARIFDCTMDAIRGQAWLLKLRKNKKVLMRSIGIEGHRIGDEGEKIAENFFREKVGGYFEENMLMSEVVHLLILL